MPELIRQNFDSLMSVAIRALSVLAGFGITFYIGRQLGPTANGQYAIITQTAMFLSVVAVGGIDMAIVREFSAAIAKKLRINRQTVIRTIFCILSLIALIVLILLFGGEQLLTTILGSDLPNGALAILCLLFIARTFTRTMSAVLRSQKSYISGQLIEVLIIPVTVLAAIFSGYFQTLEELLWICVGAATFSAVTGTFLSLRGTASQNDEYNVSIKRLVRFALPLWGVAMALNFADWYGLATVAASVGIYEAGLYRVAIQVASAIAIISIGLFSVFSAQISAAYAADNLAKVGTLAKSAVHLSAVLVLPAALILFLTAEWILQLIGPEFTAAADVLKIMVVGQAIYTMTGPSGLTLALTGHQNISFILTAASTLLLLVLAPLGAHFAGIVGVALAVSALLILRNLISLYLVRRLTGINILTGHYSAA